MIQALPIALVVTSVVIRASFGKGPLTCTDEKKTCDGRCSEWIVLQPMEKPQTCSCNPQWRYLFEDCCADYKTYCRAFHQHTIDKNFTWGCRSVLGSRHLLQVVDSCMEGWPDDEMSANCSTREAKSLLDVRLAVPVNVSKVLFRNMYCALCNGFRVFTPWEVGFTNEVKLNHSKSPNPNNFEILYNPSTLAKYVNI